MDVIIKLHMIPIQTFKNVGRQGEMWFIQYH